MADRDFKGVWIPKEVWLDERLSMLDKGILAEIDSLDNGEDGCFASNEYIAKFCQCSERKVTDSVSRLINLGYVKLATFDGRKRYLRSCLEESARRSSKNCESDQQNPRHNNIPSNTHNNTDKGILADADLPGFIEFWKNYPNKVKKSSAISAWKSGNLEKIADRIVADVMLRCGTEWNGQDMHYIPHPTTYLHQRRWEDETAPTARAERNNSQSPAPKVYTDPDYENNW